MLHYEKITTKEQVNKILHLFAKPLWLKIGYTLKDILDCGDLEQTTTQDEHTSRVISQLRYEVGDLLLSEVFVDAMFGC